MENQASPSGLDKIAKALASAQKSFLHVAKRGFNPHFNSKFSTLADIIDATKEALAENGLAICSCPLYDKGLVGVTTKLIHESGQSIEATLLLKPTNDNPQAAGSAVSYARRYTLSGILNLASEDDDDGNAASVASSHRMDEKAQNAALNMASKPTHPGSINPATFLIQFGKYKGSVMTDLNPDEALNYARYLLDSAKKTNKPLSAGASAFVAHAEEYAKLKPSKKEDPFQEGSREDQFFDPENIPF